MKHYRTTLVPCVNAFGQDDLRLVVRRYRRVTGRPTRAPLSASAAQSEPMYRYSPAVQQRAAQGHSRTQEILTCILVFILMPVLLSAFH